jgi:hypothetical protein
VTGSIRVWAAALLSALTVRVPTPRIVDASGPFAGFADILRPCRRGRFKGACGNTGGGFFNFLPVPQNARAHVSPRAIANIATRPDYTLGLEAGYFVTPDGRRLVRRRTSHRAAKRRA